MRKYVIVIIHNEDVIFAFEHVDQIIKIKIYFKMPLEFVDFDFERESYYLFKHIQHKQCSHNTSSGLWMIDQ